MKRIALMAVVVVVPSVSSASVQDQVNLPTNTGFNGFNSSLSWQQEVIAGVSGKLVGVDLYVTGVAGNGGFDFTVNVGSPWQSDTPEFAALLFANQSDVPVMHIDVSSADIQLMAGDSFTLNIHAPLTNNGIGFAGSSTIINNGVGEYPGELWLLNTNVIGGPSLYSGGNLDMAFGTYMELEPNPVPEPTTFIVWSFLAFCGIALPHRRTRRR